MSFDIRLLAYAATNADPLEVFFKYECLNVPFLSTPANDSILYYQDTRLPALSPWVLVSFLKPSIVTQMLQLVVGTVHNLANYT